MNEELKLKLAECEKQMREIVQKNEKLQLEHDQVLKNYTSLLKTAQTEMQRKSERITDLAKRFEYCTYFWGFNLNHCPIYLQVRYTMLP